MSEPNQLDTPMKDTDIMITPLSALEISGAISARVIHDLSNLISGIVGNAEYAQSPAADPASLQKAIRAIGVSANAAGKLLGQCLPLQRLISHESFPFDVSELAPIIAEAAGLAPGWHVIEPAPLTGQVHVNPRWLSAAVWQLARETHATGGEMEFASGPVVFPVRWNGANLNVDRPIKCFHITLRYRASQPLFTNDEPPSPERFALLAACELIRGIKGQIQSRPKPPGRHEITLLIPLLT